MTSGLANVDLVEILFTLFWIFFVILVLYLHRESKREGYPLVSDRSDHVTVQGFPAMPPPKEYLLEDGTVVTAPRDEAPEVDVALEPAAPHPGSPFVPTGNPMVDGVGPAAYARRSDRIETTLEGTPRIVPMRASPNSYVDSKDPDPRGMPVIAADDVEVGTVRDFWIDLAEPQIYYLEVGSAEGEGQTTLVPFEICDLDKANGRVVCTAVYSHQFGDAPKIQGPDQITPAEEDRIVGFFAGGLMFADKDRGEPLF